MPDKFDPYREALVMETRTLWAPECSGLDVHERQQIAEALHRNPRRSKNLEYLRMHTGFCRQVTVTQEDVERFRNGGIDGEPDQPDGDS